MTLTLSYRVAKHEYHDGEFVNVTLKLSGYPTHATHPTEWHVELLVPKPELASWPLGEFVKLTIS